MKEQIEDLKKKEDRLEKQMADVMVSLRDGAFVPISYGKISRNPNF